MSSEPVTQRLERASLLLTDGRLFEARSVLLGDIEERPGHAGRLDPAADWLWELDFQTRLTILDRLIDSVRAGVIDPEPIRLLGWTLDRRVRDLRRYIDPDISAEEQVFARWNAVEDEEVLLESVELYHRGATRRAARGFRRLVVSTEHQLEQIRLSRFPDRMPHDMIHDYRGLLDQGPRILGRWRTLRHAAQPWRTPLRAEIESLSIQLDRQGLDALVELPREQPQPVEVTPSLALPESGGDFADKGGAPPSESPRGGPGGPGEPNGGGSNGPPEADTPPREIRRTPHLDLTPESALAPGTAFRADLYADRNHPRSGEQAQDISLTLSPEQRRITVSVELLVSDHFRLSGSGRTRRLLLDVDQDRTKTVRFQLKVRSAQELRDRFTSAAEMRRGFISAVFNYEGRPCGSVTREISLTVSGRRSKLTARRAERPAALRLSLDAERPDLTIQVRSVSDDGRDFRCKVSTHLIRSRHNNVWRKWLLGDSPEEIVRGFMEGFVDERLSPRGRRGELLGAGVNLFKVAPSNFKAIFWEMRDQKRAPRTIAILSEEAFIPWELMVPRRGRGKREETLAPLGVLAAIGRYTARDGNSGPQRFRLRRSLVVAPRYTENALPRAEEEAEFVLEQVPGVPLRPALLDPLLAELDRQAPDLLHFVGHGADERNRMQSLILEEEQRLRASAVPGHPEIHKAFMETAPLVMLNACEVGRPTPSLRGVGGLAQALIDRGAGGVVAALWTVFDDIANEVAREFYREVMRTPTTPFAEILRVIRGRAYEGQNAGEYTFAAYCFYGDPCARRQ